MGGVSTRWMAEGVWFARGPASNWIVLVGDGEVGLIDAGYPADVTLVERSIAEAGGAGLPLRGILLTHGHSDHLGGAGVLAARSGATVWASADELPNVRREVLEQITLRRAGRSLWRPRFLRWALRAVRAGGLADVAVPDARRLPERGLTLGGSRVLPVPTPGHTSGHTVYLLPASGVLVTGDALVTGHPTSTHVGPQLLPEVFHHDPAAAHASLAALLDLDADIILPGHGEALHERPSRAVDAALRSAQVPLVTRGRRRRADDSEAVRASARAQHNPWLQGGIPMLRRSAAARAGRARDGSRGQAPAAFHDSDSM